MNSLKQSEKRVKSLLRNVRFPEAWYQTEVSTQLIADRRFLRIFYALGLCVTAAVFIAQVYIYSEVVTTEIVIDGNYIKPNFECRPLNPDPSYKLRMNYSECLEDFYTPPTIENLLNKAWSVLQSS